MFSFEGDAILSKSWLNRFQIIQYFNPHLALPSMSDSEDVVYLNRALSEIGKTDFFNLGQGGTSFRFSIFAVSRLSGRRTVTGHPRLFERPQASAAEFFNQLGIKCEFLNDKCIIESEGWYLPEVIKVSPQLSSQFVSGFLLSCWNLKKALKLEVTKPVISESYLQMTIDMLMACGMKLKTLDTPEALVIEIPAGQRADKTIKPEPDVSSIFSLAASAVVNGEVFIKNWNSQSTQPDLVFLKIFDLMKIRYEADEQSFKIKKQTSWKAVDVNLSKAPDLFPVLAVLCALADGVSVLHGAEQLKFKESNRILKTHELLNLCGFKNEIKEDGLVIYGKSDLNIKNRELFFDPDHDHRMAMAAGVLKLAGFNIAIKDPHVVNKSYPQFWREIGL